MSKQKEQNYYSQIPIVSNIQNTNQNNNISMSPIKPINPIRIYHENQETPKFMNPTINSPINSSSNSPTNSSKNSIITENIPPTPDIFKETYFISEDKIPYNIKITASFNQNSIIIEAFNREEITLFNYYNVYTKKDLSKIYNIFNSFATIKDIFESFCSVVNKKKVIIKKQNQINKEFLEIVIGFFTISGDEHELVFKLKRKQIDFNEIHQKLWERFTLLQKKIKRLKSENSNYEQRLNKIEKNINSINDNISSLDENKDFLSVKNNLSLCDKIINSKIIKNKEKYTFLEKSYKKLVNNLNCEKLKFNLIYRASVNGDSSKNFHKFCDNKKNILCLIKTNKNKIIGGFSEIGWRLSKNIIKDKNTFLFSLSKEKLYPFKNSLNDNISIIYKPKSWGFLASSFGASLVVYDNAFKNGGACCSKDVCLFDGYDKDYDINDGENNFGINEIECFQIDCDNN